MARGPGRRPGGTAPVTDVLLVVSDGSGDAERVERLGAAAARGGAWAFLLREPRLAARRQARLAAGLVRDHPQLAVLVAERPDLALAAGAHGVQLGERGLPLAPVRRWAGERLRYGRSVHDAGGARRAAAAGADWLVFGHVFATRSKAGRAPAGLAALAAVAGAVSIPVLAIGGIDGGRLAAVAATGAAGIAVIRAVAGATEPERAVRELVGGWTATRGG